MKRAVLLLALLLSAAGYVFLQTPAPRTDLAALMPGGALLYLEARDFEKLLREWDQSKLKAGWLSSDNYEQFSRSNLLQKLEGVYREYGAAAGFLPGLSGLHGIAGGESALALYEIREVEFLYISRVGQARLARSQLWSVRDRFEQRQAGGATFYLRTDPASGRAVAFAFANGYLFVATRDDLVARALALLSGSADPAIATDRWYRDAARATSGPGELRLAMHLEALTRSVYFRSYWIQRNTPDIRQYWTGIADLTRSAPAITETRVFLRGQPATRAAAYVSELAAMVPSEAGMYKAFASPSAAATAALIVHKLIAPPTESFEEWRYAPGAVSPDETAGTEGDLETRIDEPPPPADAGVAQSISAAQSFIGNAGVESALLTQASAQAGGPFVRTPAVIVLTGDADWDPATVRRALSAAAGPLWTASELGVGWTAAAAGSHSVERLDGLGALLFASRGRLLYLANDAGLLSATLDRAPTTPAAGAITYAAGFRHSRERGNFNRIMMALDFGSSAGRLFRFGDNAAPFFSGNLAGLSRTLSRVSEIRVTEEAGETAVKQVVVYSLAP
jgi:hypothetical protein